MMEHTTSLSDRLVLAAASWADTHPGLAALLSEAAEMDASLTMCLSALADLRRALGDDGSRRLSELVAHAARVYEYAESALVVAADDQTRAAVAALRAQDSEHRSAQAAVYAALGPGADPDRATWPDQIRALRERADAADTVAQGAAQ